MEFMTKVICDHAGRHKTCRSCMHSLPHTAEFCDSPKGGALCISTGKCFLTTEDDGGVIQVKCVEVKDNKGG
jgi:hypothetical protein